VSGEASLAQLMHCRLGMVALAQQQLRGFLLRLKRFGLNRDALVTAARAGWVARGVLYIILGGLATLAAVGEGGGLHDGDGIVQWIMRLPAGTLLVALAACGFAGYALYSAALLVFGQENADSAFAAAFTRIKGAIGCMVYGSLTLTSVQLLLGHHKSGNSKEVWFVSLFHAPFGRFVIGAIGVFLIGFGVYQCMYAVSDKHRKEVSVSAMGDTESVAFLWIGRLGMIARGIVFGVIGTFTVRAAVMAANSGKTTSTSGALREIRDIGWLPLVIVAIGLAAYGVLQLFYAKYRKVDVA
jgi:hypothetical protein